MLGPKGNRSREEVDTDLDMVPIMNMFLVLIPFLLISASFFHLKAINTSVPVLGSSDGPLPVESTIKITVIAQLEDKGIRLSAISDEADTATLGQYDAFLAKEEQSAYPLDDLASFLTGIKERYPLSDTLIIIPEGDVIYDTIIKTMDVARNSNNAALFPNVVISGKVG